MKKKKKLKALQPDEVFSAGMMTVVRFGEKLLFQSNVPAEKYGEMHQEFAKKFIPCVQEIDALVTEIADLVRKLPPDQLLHRAWWILSERLTKIKSEVELKHEDITSLRMVDYIQSIIASVEPDKEQFGEVTDEHWDQLRRKVETLFQRVTHDYHVYKSAKNKIENPNFDFGYEEFTVKACMQWCNVRGNLHQVHKPAYLRDMFLPHSDIFLELFGITSEFFVAETIKIWHSLIFGLGEAINSMKQFQHEAIKAIQMKYGADSKYTLEEMQKLITDVIQEKEWESRQKQMFGQIFELDLFDVQKLTNLPHQLLEELSWSPGQDKEFFADGDMRGWPLRIWPIFKRPFIKLNGRYCCFDYHNLFDHLYRTMQRIVFRLEPNYREKWKLIQQKQSEDLPIQYLKQILPDAIVFQQVYYPIDVNGKMEWGETDGLLIYDDHLFIIECRGGSFTYTSPANDFEAYVNSLKNLVLKPAIQGRRFLNYLLNTKTAPIFDVQRNQIRILNGTDLRKITICTVTLDFFTDLTAQVQHLKKIGVDVGQYPIWAISLNDLRAYADIFDNPLTFLHFVEQRGLAFESDILHESDELDHLGLYLEYNHYSKHAAMLRGDSEMSVNFSGFGQKIDHFFGERLLDPNYPCPLKQKIPTRLLEVINFLADLKRHGRSNISSFLLDFSGETREWVANAIEQELVRQSNMVRSQAISLNGETNLTVFCWTPTNVRYGNKEAEAAFHHAQKVLIANHEEVRLLLELIYDDNNVLQDCWWRWVKRAEILPTELTQLTAEAQQLKQKRLNKAFADRRKIGRNDPCPCGSNKKYKKCCWLKS